MRKRATGFLLAGVVGVMGLGCPAWAQPLEIDPCPPLQAQRPVPAPSPQGALPSAAASSVNDYRHLLRPTPLGWARLDHWCIWIEPAASPGPAALWDGRWRQAVNAALAQWQALLPLTMVADPARAQVRLLRRKPPLHLDRASHGRAELVLVETQRGQPQPQPSAWQIEPLVLVQLSPGQGVAAMQATALHELGHAFGLWGHSDQADDALAAVPGARPVLQLSPRDRATLHWLQTQPALISPAGARPAAGQAPAAPGAN